MISAKEAREKTDKVKKEYLLTRIEPMINRAIEKGCSSVYVDFLDTITKEELEGLGYEIKFYPGGLFTGDEWRISW